MEADPTSDWVPLESSTYKLSEIWPQAKGFAKLDLSFLNVAIAKYGGPVAVTRNMDDIVILHSDDPTKDNICIFGGNGNMISSIPFVEEDRIIGMSFMKDDLLLVVLEMGKFYLIDPYKGIKIKSMTLGSKFEEEKLVEIKVYDQGFAFLTKKNQFYFITNCSDPHVTKFFEHKFANAPNDWDIIPPQFTMSEKIEAYITNEEKGILVLVSDESRKITYNNENDSTGLPFLPQIVKLAVSPSFKNVAYLTSNLDLFVLSSDLTPEEPIRVKLSYYIKNEGRIKKMIWVGNDALLLSFKNSVYLVSEEGCIQMAIQSSKTIFSTEIDGARILTPKMSLMLRKIPEAYINIFKLLSFEPGALLYEAYNSYESRNPLPDEEIRSKKDELAKGVSDCLAAASFELNPEIQKKLLKAVSYGKAFLTGPDIEFEHSALYFLCKHIRILNSIKSEMFARVMTVDQMKEIGEQNLLNLMLRYKCHALASDYCEIMGLNENLKSQVYIDWACCKVESLESDEKLCSQIADKMKNVEIINYVEIATKAFEVGKKILATKLIELEPCLNKRVPLLLAMDNYEKALSDALQSKESNLIYQVILKFTRNRVHNELFNLMAAQEETKSHLINYYKNFNAEALNNFYISQKMFDECGLILIKQAFISDNFEEKLKSLQFALNFYEKQQDYFNVDVLKEIKAFTETTKNTKKEALNKPISRILEIFIQNNDIKSAEELKKIHKIPERRFLLMRIKVLIAQKAFPDLDRLLSEKNSKTPHLIPYDVIAGLCIKEKEMSKAEDYLQRIPDVDEQLNYLRDFGFLDKAAEVAMNKKRLDVLQEIHASADINLKNAIDGYLMNLKK